MTLSKSVLGSVAALSLTVVSAFASVPAQTSSCNYMFNTNLRLGAVSTDVQNLQKLLNMDIATRVAVTGSAGSMGYETLRFGPATLSAAKRFQAANGVSPVSGYVGPLTRAALNTICTGNSNTTTTPTPTNTGSGVVSNNIPVSVLVAGQASAKLGEFVVSGNGNVTMVELMRTGLSNNATLKNVYLYDGATRLTSASSVLSNGTIKFSSSAGLFMVSGSKTITVRADILTGTSGQTVGVALTGVTMMGATSTPVTGVQGPLFSISSATIAGANLTTTSPSPSLTTLNAGSMNQTVWSNNVSISQNNSRLVSATFKMIGSAPSNTLANVQLYVNGVSRGSATINSMNQYVFNVSGSPVAFNTGSQFVELRADVVGGANRNFYMVLEEASDLLIEDTVLPGIYVTPTYQGGTLVNVQGGTVTVNNGTLTVNQDASFNNTTTLVSGATGVKMGAFTFTAYGEDVKVTTLTFTPQFTGTGASTTLVNVGLYVNGGQVGSNQTATHNTALQFTNLGTNLQVTAGQSATVEIRGDVVNSTNQSVTAPQVVQFNIASSVAQGVSSSQTAPSVSSGGQSMTISSSNVTFALAAGSAISTKAPNQAQVKIGSFTVQTGSSEGITINTIMVGQTGTMGNQLTNLTVKDGSTTLGTPVGQVNVTNNFSANLSVPSNTTKVFDVYADFGSGAATLTAIPTMSLTYRGNISNLTSTTPVVTGLAVTANIAIIANTDITFVPASSPVAQFVVAGQSALGIATYNVKANNIGGAVIKDITFNVPANTIASVTVNGKTASVVGTTATIFDSGIVVPADASGINIPVTVSLVCVNSSGGCAGVANSALTLTWGATTYNNGSTVATVAAVPSVSTVSHSLVSTKPIVSMTSSSGTGFNSGTIQVGTFTVAADAGGDIKLEAIPVVVNISGAAVITAGTLELRDASGNTVIVGAGGVNGSAGLNGSGTFSFNTSPRTVTKGTSETYTVWATFTGVTGGSNTMNETFQLGAKASFLWTDVLGNITGITGANLNTYPNVSQTKSN